MPEEELTVLENVKEIRPTVRGFSRIALRPLNLHFTANRIYASPTTETPRGDLARISRLSIEYVDVRKIGLTDYSKLRQNYSEFRLWVNYYSGTHHFWSTKVPFFLTTQPQFDELRILLPTISALKGKVTLLV